MANTSQYPNQQPAYTPAPPDGGRTWGGCASLALAVLPLLCTLVPQLLGIHLYTTCWVRNILVIIDFVCLIASLVIAIVTYPEQAGGHRIVSTIAILLSAGLTAAGGMLIFLMFINQ